MTGLFGWITDKSECLANPSKYATSTSRFDKNRTGEKEGNNGTINWLALLLLHTIIINISTRQSKAC